MFQMKKDDMFGFGGTMHVTQQKIQNLGKVQSEILAEAVERGMKLQKEQYDLATRMVQNQIAHSNALWQSCIGCLNVVNSNIKDAVSPAAKAEKAPK